MKIAIEAYVSIFIICLCLVLCACLISADLEVANARDAYTTYTLQLQDSNFADSVVQACKSDAEKRGYQIDISVYEDASGNKSGTVELQYEYSIPVIGYTAYRYIRGYAS